MAGSQHLGDVGTVDTVTTITGGFFKRKISFLNMFIFVMQPSWEFASRPGNFYYS